MIVVRSMESRAIRTLSTFIEGLGSLSDYPFDRGLFIGISCKWVVSIPCTISVGQGAQEWKQSKEPTYAHTFHSQ